MLPKPDSAIVFKRLEEGAVLFHTRQEVYFGLNSVGARIWELLPTCTSMAELCAGLAAEYPDVEPAVLEQDAQELIDQFAAQKLVQPDHEDGSRTGQNAISPA